MMTNTRPGGVAAVASLAFTVLLILGSPAGGAEPAPAAQVPASRPAALLTPAESKEADAVIAAMLAAGFPDAKGAVVYSGKLTVTATFDPAKEPHPLPSGASNMQRTDPNSSKVTYGYEFDGLHFKLADGSWVIGLACRFKPKAGDTVTPAGDAAEVKVGSITADAIAAHPFDAAKDGEQWLQRVAPAQRERARASMDRLVPVTQYLRLRPDDLAPAVVLLQRAGWPEAATLSLAIADQRARQYWQLRPWTNPDPAFDPTGEYPNSKEEEAAWRQKTAAFTAEAPAVALRRALFRGCRAQLLVEAPEGAMLAPAAAP